MRLTEKVAIITGGASGIGHATSVLFAKEGACVVVADWNDAQGFKVTNSIQENGGNALFVHTDVKKEDDIQNLVNETVKKYHQINILVNNAAYVGVSSPVVDLSADDWDMIVDTTLKSAFLTAKYAIPEMIKARGGSIVNVSSVGGVVAFESNPAYLAAKGGVIQLAKGIALDYGQYGIRANSVCPGTIDTPGTSWIKDYPDVIARVESRTVLKRQGTSEEMAYVILFLASDESSYVTGANFIADGGWTVI